MSRPQKTTRPGLLTHGELRHIRKARAYLLDHARSIRESHTDNDGEWGDEVSAKAWYDNCLSMADNLRAIVKRCS